jgi:hypothetical protein
VEVEVAVAEEELDLSVFVIEEDADVSSPTTMDLCTSRM